jgi:hypothetical protein
MKRLKPGQVLAPKESLADYADSNQAGLLPGERKLTMFKTALRVQYWNTELRRLLQEIGPVVLDLLVGGAYQTSLGSATWSR